MQDPLGDAASNIGRFGHCGRHNSLLAALAKVMRSVRGSLVEVQVEPRDHAGPTSRWRAPAARAR